ncbi:MAG: tyrosine-type recombinase/integrase [Litoreibacter sp.]
MTLQTRKWTPAFLDNMTLPGRNEPRIELTDPATEGLMLRATHRGIRWSVVYRVTGQGGFNQKTGRELKGPQQRMVIGKYPVVGLKVARDKADEIRTMADQGNDPKELQIATVKAKQKAVEEQRNNSVTVVIDGMLALKAAKNRSATVKNLKNLIKNHILPGFEKYDIEQMSDITAVKINRLLNDTIEAGQWNTATKIKNVVRMLIEYGIENGHMDHDPRREIKKMEGKNPQPMKDAEAKFLSTNHTKVIWNRAKALGYPWGDLIQLLMLTGCRTIELRTAKWSDIDFERKALHLTKAKSKIKQETLIPFSDRAWQIVENLKHGNRGDFLFSTDGGEKPVNSNTYSKKLINKGIPEEFHAWSNHDLRHTFRSKLSELRVPTHIAELALGHKLQGIEATYNHHDFLDEKREAAELYAQFIGGLDD